MYKVFVNELPLILTNKLSETANGEYFPLNENSIQDAIKSLKKKKLNAAYIYHPNHEEILKKFTKEIPLVVAASTWGAMPDCPFQTMAPTPQPGCAKAMLDAPRRMAPAISFFMFSSLIIVLRRVLPNGPCGGSTPTVPV